MSKHSLRSAAAIFLTVVSLINSALAAPSLVGATLAAPTAIDTNKSSSIVVTSTITSPSIIAGSVILQRLNTDGTVNIIVGNLHDDGLNGDAKAGDHIYTISFPLNETSPTILKFRVSVAFLGILQRQTSDPFSIVVRGNSTPEQMISQLSSELSNGNIDAAFQHFNQPGDLTVLQNLTPTRRNLLAAAFQRATFVESDGNTQTYNLPWDVDDGTPSSTKFVVIQIPTGEWIITSW